MEIGTFCTFSDLFCAVTTISPTPPVSTAGLEGTSKVVEAGGAAGAAGPAAGPGSGACCAACAIAADAPSVAAQHPSKAATCRVRFT